MIDTVRLGRMAAEFPRSLVERMFLDVTETTDGRRNALGSAGGVACQVREVTESVFSIAFEASLPKLLHGSNWSGLPVAELDNAFEVISRESFVPVDDLLEYRVRRLDLCVDSDVPARPILESLVVTDPQRNAVVASHLGVNGATVTVKNRSGAGTLYDKGAESGESSHRLRFEARERSGGSLRGDLRLTAASLRTFDHRSLMRSRFDWAFSSSTFGPHSFTHLLDRVDLTPGQRSQGIAYVSLVSAGIDPRLHFSSSMVSRMRKFAGGRGVASASGVSLDSLFDWEAPY